LSLTFDGENCTYDGPSEITPGPVALDFHNEWDRTDSKTSSAVGLAKLLGDTTVQSQIDGIEAGQQHHNPSEVSIVDAAWNPIPTGESYRYEGSLSSGTYVMVCNKVIFNEAYWGAALVVTD
ncbi:MAG: hypothetical protein KJN63_04695, partial [Acidimicrobiia bacterium]|nr:hypothetical protein [Acidimicrobiia bacterium]